MPTDKVEADKQREGFIRSVARTTETSPLVSGLRVAGAEVIPRVIAHRHQAYWNATKDHVLGSDAQILTDLGKMRVKNDQPWLAAKALAKNAVNKAPPSMSQHMAGAVKKMDDPRGILDVESFTGKLAEYGTQKKVDVDAKIADELLNSLVETFNHYGDLMKQKRATRIEDIDIWIAQLNPNRNSGNPDYTPVTKEQALNDYWPVMRETIIDIVKNGNMFATLPPYTDNVYAGFHRSPNRPIHGAGIFDKLIGAFLNYHLVDGLAYGSRIAWENLEDMWVGLSEAMGSAESSMHDDFDAYDNHFGLALNKVIYRAFLDSSLFSDNRELRNAFQWFCERLIAEDSLLQISPTHALVMRPSLFSGTPVTQFWGCVFHDAFYHLLEHVYGFGIIDARVLSDDGIAIMETPASETARLMDEYARPVAEALGHELSPAGVKSYVADLTVERRMHNDVDIITHDMGPFLQFYPQRDPSNTFGNVPRRLYSLYERERDSSDATRTALLNQYAPSLAKAALGTDKKIMANWVSDLHRSLDVLSTIGPRYPRIREILKWFGKVYPNFWKKFIKLYGAADPALWSERSMMAGGTRQGGASAWVVEHFKEWKDSGVQPAIPRKIA